MTKLNDNLLLMFLMAFLQGCVINSTAGERMGGSLYMLPTECDLSTITNNSEEEFDCSPQLVDRYFSPFQGLLINGPQDVTWPKDFNDDNISVNPMGDTSGPFKLLIAGLVKLPYNTMNLRGDFGKHLIVVAINEKMGLTYNGKMSAFGITDDGPDVDPEGYGDVKRYYNIDLIQNLGIPIEAAIYTVYATLGKYRSNILTINVSVQ